MRVSRRKYKIAELVQTDNDELVLAKILNKTREFVLSHPEQELSAPQFKNFKSLKEKLLKGLPLAYILGYRWFDGNKFAVDPEVLIPRPETEQLVELAIQAADRDKPGTVIDVGTGSGAIIISMAKKLRGQAKYYASDISAKSITVAKKNAKSILGNSSITFLHGDLLTPFLKKCRARTNLLILANLPYLSKFEMSEPTIRREPKHALLGGRVGYELIKKLIEQIAAAKIQNSRIFLEIGFSQGKDLNAIIKKSLPQAKIKIHKDLAGLDRIIEISLK